MWCLVLDVVLEVVELDVDVVVEVVVSDVDVVLEMWYWWMSM